MGKPGSHRYWPNRRDFLKRTAMGTAGFALASSLPDFPAKASFSGGKTSRVVIVTDVDVSSGSSIASDVLQVMMDRGIMELTDEVTAGGIWLPLFPGITPTSRIGIKVNVANPYLPSHPQVAEAIVHGLVRMEVGGQPFPENNILIWDQTNSELEAAGYEINESTSGPRCYGTDPGVGYSSTPLSVHDQQCQPSRILTEQCDYLINLSCLKNHGLAGVTLSLKNHLGSVNNPWDLHGSWGEHCDPYIPALNKQIQDRLDVPQVVNICDAIFGILSGGPSGSPQFAYKGLLLSQDPVALDYQGMLILEDQGCQTTDIATHIATAAGSPYDLGTNDPGQMDVRRIVDPSTGVLEDGKSAALPNQSRLGIPYPNPFNARTVIPYHIGGESPVSVRLDVFNIRGQRVRTLLRGMREPGGFQIVWDGRDEMGAAVASGTYLCRLSAAGHEASVKITLLR